MIKIVTTVTCDVCCKTVEFEYTDDFELPDGWVYNGCDVYCPDCILNYDGELLT